MGKLEDVNPPITVGSVGHLPAPNPDSDDAVTVSAQVAHETGVGSVELVFSLDGNLQQDLAMLDDWVDGDGSANDGVYAAGIGPFPAGTRVEYQVRATDVTGNSVLAPSSSLSFDTLEPVAKTSHVLMVAERHFSQGEHTYYHGALDNLGFPHDFWKVAVRGPIDTATLNQYLGGVVVWAMPIDGSLISSSVQNTLISYLDAGGNLFISGQGVASYMNGGQFLEGHVYARYVHSTDSIDKESLSTRGRSVWAHSSQVRLLDSCVPRNSLPERVGPLGPGVARPRGMMPNPARRSGAELDEQGRTSGLRHDWSVPVNS